MSGAFSDRAPKPVVLLVDDDVDLLETTSALLEDDFDVITARSGGEALQRFAESDPDVVCTDFNMPGMNGIELLRVTMSQRRYVSGVLVSGYREFLDSSAKRGADRYLLLVKPYSPDALSELLHTAVKYTAVKRNFSPKGTANVA